MIFACYNLLRRATSNYLKGYFCLIVATWAQQTRKSLGGAIDALYHMYPVSDEALYEATAGRETPASVQEAFDIFLSK